MWWYTPVILAMQEVETGGSHSNTSQGKKLARPYLKSKLGVVLCTCSHSYSRGRGRKEDLDPKPTLGKNTRPYLN
jgi:hypothetical protein